MKGVWEVISSYDYKKRSRRQGKVKRMKENRDRERKERESKLPLTPSSPKRITKLVFIK